MSQRIRARRLTPSSASPRRPGRLHRRRRQRRQARVAVPGDGLPNTQGNLGGSNPAEPVPYRGHGAATAAIVCILLGATVSLAIVGLTERLDRDFSGYSRAHTVVIAGVLLALAIGVRVPQRFAIWACTLAWRRFASRGRPSALSDVLIGVGSADRSLYWLALAVIALVSGIVTALLPLSVRFAIMAHDWVYGHFVWSTVPLTVLQTATVLLAGVIPLMTVGVAISCAHHVSCRFGQWDSRATGWLALGSAGGVLLSTALYRLTGRADLTLFAAALPTLLVSLACAGRVSSRSCGAEAEPGAALSPLPMWSDRWPTLLRASIVLVGCSGVCSIVVWASRAAAGDAGSGAVFPAMFGAFGVGVLAGSRAKRSGLRSIGGFGVTCSAAGVITAAATFFALDTLGSVPGAVLSAACLSVGVMAFAMAYGHQTLLHRVASRSAVGATILGRLLVGGALTCVAAPLLMNLFTVPATLVMLALFLTALGGALIVHEPAYSPRTRRLRLCAVCASIVGIIAITPPSDSPLQAEPTSKPAAALKSVARVFNPCCPPVGNRCHRGQRNRLLSHAS